MSAFAGQFGYKELLSLDIRDLMFWFKKAQKKLVEDQIKRIQAARLAMAETNDYSKAVSDLESQLKQLEFGKEKVIKENWNDLMSMSRKKR